MKFKNKKMEVARILEKESDPEKLALLILEMAEHLCEWADNGCGNSTNPWSYVPNELK